MREHAIKYFVFFLCICIISGHLFNVSCFAMDIGFALEDVTEDEFSSVCTNLALSVIDEPDIDVGFCCFDVNESGDYALGFDLPLKDIILVYDSTGSYQYGFSFSDNGAFGLEWDNENIVIYRVRSDLAISVDSSGNILEMGIIPDTLENNEYWNNEVNANKRNVAGVTYTAEHWIANHEWLRWGAYPRLVKTMPDGERIVLFDQPAFSVVTSVILVVLIIAAFLTVIGFFIRRCLKYYGY